MKNDNVNPQDLEWICHQCGEPMAPGQVTVTYLGNEFVTNLPVCPKCGLVLISEEIALGKMAEVERILEDK